jgi:MscS family membrane protein
MLGETLSRTYYGNTVGQWALALVIIVAALVVGRTLYWVFKNVFGRLTKKTESKLDDMILDMIVEPIVFAVTVMGIWYGLNTLTLPEAVSRWTGNGLQLLIVVSITWLLARLADSVFTHYLAPLAERSENDLDDQLLPIVRKGAKLSIWALGIIVALNNSGYDVGAVLAGLGIGGLALAMAAKDTVSNVFGGFTIFTDRPFTLGDRIRVGDYDGTVKEIGIRSTRLQTLAGTLVTIPNASFSDNAVENVSAEPSRKVVMNLGLTYDTTPEGMERGMAILREIGAANDSLEENVLVAFNEFGDSAMNILLIYYIKSGSDILGAMTAINMEILRRFGEAGLEFAFPTQTLYTIPQSAAS